MAFFVTHFSFLHFRTFYITPFFLIVILSSSNCQFDTICHFRHFRSLPNPRIFVCLFPTLLPPDFYCKRGLVKVLSILSPPSFFTAEQTGPKKKHTHYTFVFLFTNRQSVYLGKVVSFFFVYLLVLGSYYWCLVSQGFQV